MKKIFPVFTDKIRKKIFQFPWKKILSQNFPVSTDKILSQNFYSFFKKNMDDEKNINLKLTEQQVDELQNKLSAGSLLSTEQDHEKSEYIKSINIDFNNMIHSVYEQVRTRPKMLADRETLLKRNESMPVWGTGDLNFNMKIAYTDKKNSKKGSKK